MIWIRACTKKRSATFIKDTAMALNTMLCEIRNIGRNCTTGSRLPKWLYSLVLQLNVPVKGEVKVEVKEEPKPGEEEEESCDEKNDDDDDQFMPTDHPMMQKYMFFVVRLQILVGLFAGCRQSLQILLLRNVPLMPLLMTTIGLKINQNRVKSFGLMKL